MRKNPELAQDLNVNDSVLVNDLDPEIARYIAQTELGITNPTEEELIQILGSLGDRIKDGLGIVAKFATKYKRAYEIAYVDVEGIRNGMYGIVFRGEAEKICDILVHY